MIDAEVTKTATVFDMRYGDPNNGVLTWLILNDNQHVLKSEYPMKYLDELVFKQQSDFKDDRWDVIFFEEFLPRVTGHALLMDEFHRDMRSPYYSMVSCDNIKFHDNKAEDPDWTVKQCYLLLIAANTKADVELIIYGERGIVLEGMNMQTLVNMYVRMYSRLSNVQHLYCLLTRNGVTKTSVTKTGTYLCHVLQVTMGSGVKCLIQYYWFWMN
jgi:hypothetical protein